MPTGGTAAYDEFVETISLSAGTGAERTSSENGSSVDLADTLVPVECAAHVGLVSAGTTATLKLQESADDSTFTDVDGASVTIATTDDDSVVRFQTDRRKQRYGRLVLTLSGGSPGIVMSGSIRAKKKSY